MKRLILVVVLAASTGAPAKSVTVQGLGGDSCATWTEEHGRNRAMAAGQDAWVTGYLSGYNAFGAGNGNVVGGRPFIDVKGAMDAYCATHPLDTIEIAAASVIAQLEHR